MNSIAYQGLIAASTVGSSRICTQAHHRQRGEPDHHDRPERRCDARGAAALNREQHDENEDRQRHDVMFERRRRELETFDRRQHRNRRRDHGIADEHRGADHAERQQGPASAAERALAERHQRKRAALAVVVGAQQQQHVFCGDDDEQRPQDQREHAEHDDRAMTGAPCAAALTASRNAYSGEVPISPNTTPMLPSVRAQKPVVAGRLVGFGRWNAESHDA